MERVSHYCCSYRLTSPQEKVEMTPCVSPVKDLDILVDSRLKFVDHIQDIVNRASKRVNLVFFFFTQYQ